MYGFTAVLLTMVLGQQPETTIASTATPTVKSTVAEQLGELETVWIPSLNSWCQAKKVIVGEHPGWYRIINTLATPTAPASTPTTAAVAQPTQGGADPYGFLGWLNSTRASYGLGAVGYDPNLTAWADQNNAQQAARGMGHHVMGPARRQNAAWMTSLPCDAWMASPGHRAALLDPTITWIGIAAAGAYWTFNAN